MARSAAPGGGLAAFRSVIAASVLGALLFVIVVELRTGKTVVVAPEPAPDCSRRLVDLPTQIAEVTARLQDVGLPLPQPTEEMQGSGTLRWVHRHYEVAAPPSLAFAAVQQHLASLAGSDPCISVQVRPEPSAADVRIGIDGLLTHTVLVRWLPMPAARVRIGLIVDELGGDLRAAREVVAIDAPLTLAVTPSQPFSKEVTELANLFHRDVLLCLPIDLAQPEEGAEFPAVPPMLTEDGVHKLLDESLQSVPHALGAIIAPSTSYARDRQRMGWAVGWLKIQNMFLIAGDSAADTVIQELAAAASTPIATQIVWLDDPSQAPVTGQLDRLIDVAREHGRALAVAHAQPATLEALRAALGRWRDDGKIDLVPVSSLVAVPTLAPQ